MDGKYQTVDIFPHSAVAVLCHLDLSGTALPFMHSRFVLGGKVPLFRKWQQCMHSAYPSPSSFAALLVKMKVWENFAVLQVTTDN